MKNYKGSVSLIGGLIQKNNKDFPLLATDQIMAKEDGTKLDVYLEQITKGNCTFTPWEANYDYKESDSVYYNNILYICIEEHTSGNEFEKDKWLSIIGNIDLSEKADLINNRVPSNQLPSYVDDVIEGNFDKETSIFYDDDSEEIIPESGKIYVDKLTNNSFRWSGSLYIQISNSEATRTEITENNGELKIDGVPFTIYNLPTASDTELGGVTIPPNGIIFIDGTDIKINLSENFKINNDSKLDVNSETIVTKEELPDLIKTNSTIVKTLPDPSVEEFGNIYQYIGEDLNGFIHAYFYECKKNQETGVYYWDNINVQEGSSGGKDSEIDDGNVLENMTWSSYKLNSLFEERAKIEDNSIASEKSTWSTKKIYSIQSQFEELPYASQEYLNRICQYVGPTNETLINGLFYKCIQENIQSIEEDEEDIIVYSWKEIKTNSIDEIGWGGFYLDFPEELNYEEYTVIYINKDKLNDENEIISPKGFYLYDPYNQSITQLSTHTMQDLSDLNDINESISDLYTKLDEPRPISMKVVDKFSLLPNDENVSNGTSTIVSNEEIIENIKYYPGLYVYLNHVWTNVLPKLNICRDELDNLDFDNMFNE